MDVLPVLKYMVIIAHLPLKKSSSRGLIMITYGRKGFDLACKEVKRSDHALSTD